MYTNMLSYVVAASALFSIFAPASPSELQLNCPPPFPDFHVIFENTIRLDTAKWLDIQREVKEELKQENCSCGSPTLDDLSKFNNGRCSDTSMTIEEGCVTTTPTPATTTSTTTTTAATTTPTTERSTTATPTAIPGPETTTKQTSRPSAKSTASTIPHVPSTRRRTTVTDGESRNSQQTTASSFVTDPDGGLIDGDNDGKTMSVYSSSSDKTLIVACVCAGILVVVIIGLVLLLCNRKRLSASRGVLDARLKQDKLQRQRSDCQPISPPSPDTCSEPPILPTDGSIDNCSIAGISRLPSYDPSFDTQSQASLDSRNQLLRDGGSIVYNGFDSDTLKALEHPHALKMGGFGESSTDLTLPRKKKSKSKKGQGSLKKTTDSNHNSKKNGDVVLDLGDLDGKGTVSSNGSVGGRGSVSSKGTLPGKNKRGSSKKVKETAVSSDGPADWGTIILSQQLKENQKKEAEDLVTMNNEHLFAYENQGMSTFGKDKKKKKKPEKKDESNVVPKENGGSSFLWSNSAEPAAPDDLAISFSRLPVEETVGNPQDPQHAGQYVAPEVDEEPHGYVNPAMTDSTTGSAILDPPLEFQDSEKHLGHSPGQLKKAESIEIESSSGYSSGIADDVVAAMELATVKEKEKSNPPTAIVQPSVKNLRAQFERQSSEESDPGKAGLQPNGSFSKSQSPAGSGIPIASFQSQPNETPVTNGRLSHNGPTPPKKPSVVTAQSQRMPNGHDSNGSQKQSFLWANGKPKPSAVIAPTMERTVL